MQRRIGVWTALVVLVAAAGAMGQVGPWRGPGGDPRQPGPDQPVVPRAPVLERRPAPPQPPPPPFRLTPQEEAQVDRILNIWEQRSAGVKTFECGFKRWEYDPVWGSPDKPRYEELGIIKYASPDRGVFRVEGERAEHWICDGKSLYEYKFATKQLIEQKIPPELQGKALANTPLPFLFGARAQHLKQRYFIRIITPREVQAQQTWLEAYPRFQPDAADFQRAELILTNRDMLPYAMQLYLSNGKNRVVYQFYEIVANDPLRFLKGDPFVARTPAGWEKIVKEAPGAQAGRVPPASRR